MSFLNFIPIIGDLINNIFTCVDDNMLSDEERLTLENTSKLINQKPVLMRLAIEKAESEGALKLFSQQLDVNKEEAKGNWFQRSWRPLIGWICGLSLLFVLLIPCAMTTIFWVIASIKGGHILSFPLEKVIWEQVILITGGILGIPYISRSVEKIKSAVNKN
jgi:hypothetical protein